jgi:hypothetical protein
MSEEKKFSLAEAQKEFAKRTNGEVWQLLGKSGRTTAEDEQMELAAYASLYHWLQVGTEVNHQRGEWMIAHVHTVLGDRDPALKHAKRCLHLTESFKNQMADFDIAYAYEGMARAHALAGDKETARQYFVKAKAAGDAIGNSEDKEIFTGDLESGDWYGIQ